MNYARKWPFVGRALIWGMIVSVGVAGPAISQARGFDVVVLGAHGGVTEGNLSAYMIRPIGDDRAVLCDAGTIMTGLEMADARGALDDITEPRQNRTRKSAYVARTVVRAYLISHAHLDHIAGLVTFSPEDTAKPIYALPSVNAVLTRDVFNGAVWPNMGDRGNVPRLGLYHYRDLTVGRAVQIADTSMTVTAYPLSHGGVESTAFLLEHGHDALLYLGDTGPDLVEHSHNLRDLWRAVAPLLRARRLRGIVIECSFDDTRPDGRLFGHLSPHWVLSELGELRAIAGGGNLLQGLPILVGHIKPSLDTGDDFDESIPAALRAGNRLGVTFIQIHQGEHLRLD